MSKTNKEKCCMDSNNRVLRTKTPTYREIICKKCGYVHSIHEVVTKQIH